MLVALHGVMPYAHNNTWSEALCSMLYQGKVYADSYTWIEALYSMLFMN